MSLGAILVKAEFCWNVLSTSQKLQFYMYPKQRGCRIPASEYCSLTVSGTVRFEINCDIVGSTSF
jgi:hypothetical protein